MSAPDEDFDRVSRELGPAALVRYIAEKFSQPGRDYTEERRQRPHASVDDIVDAIDARKAARAKETGAQPEPPRKPGKQA